MRNRTDGAGPVSYIQYFHAVGEQVLISEWDAQVVNAKTVDEVLLVANAFLESRPASLLATLPLACQPTPMKTAEDVSGYAFALMHRCVRRPNVVDEVLEMGRFFAAASRRLSVILTPRGLFPARPKLDPNY